MLNKVHDVARDGGIVVKSLGQLDTYGPLCDDAAKVYIYIYLYMYTFIYTYKYTC
jgi:hypothetical protein